MLLVGDKVRINEEELLKYVQKWLKTRTITFYVSKPESEAMSVEVYFIHPSTKVKHKFFVRSSWLSKVHRKPYTHKKVRRK